MNVLVTGASGFLGRYVLASLCRHAIGFVAAGRRRPEHVADDAFISADLLSLSSKDCRELIAASGATHLLHQAWTTEHGQYWRSPANLRWVEATVRLVEEFCEAGGQQVVVAGTCAEYEWCEPICDEFRTPLVPATLYGAAKDATRRLVEAICRERRVPCAWGRVFLPFGAGESSLRLVPSLIDALRGTRAPFSIDAAARRDFLHAGDVAEAFVTLLKSGASGPFNISSGETVAIDALLRELAAQLQADPAPILALARSREGEPAVLTGDNSRLRALGFTPCHTLRSGLALTLADRRHGIDAHPSDAHTSDCHPSAIHRGAATNEA